VKNLMIAAAVAAALSLPAAAQAASSDDLAQIREQLQGLMQRVDKLEHENQALKSENQQLQADSEKLKAEGDYLKAETKGLRKDSATNSAAVSAVKGTDWASKVAVKGDMRYRYEGISDEGLNASGVQNTADRYRDRIRARLSVEAKATDNILVGIGLTTTENNDPRSGNQTLSGTFTKKAVELDLAYFDWKFANWGDLIGGKMKQPFFKPAQSTYFWDNDITPEGLAISFSSGIWFGTAYNYWISEVSGPENTVTADSSVAGAQVGVKLPIGASTLTLAAHYYDLSAGQGRRNIFFNCSATSNGCANGNTTIGAAGAGVLAFDYEVGELAAEFTTNLGTLPLTLWGQYAENQDPDDLNTAWFAGFRFGTAANARTWELGAAYGVIEKDAVFAQFIDSDFAGGVSDSEGWVLRAGYVPVKNWTLNATYFMNKLNRDRANSAAQTDVDYDRLQLDFNVKF
jgi:regulator of replication initiation timing